MLVEKVSAVLKPSRLPLLQFLGREKSRLVEFDCSLRYIKQYHWEKMLEWLFEDTF